MNTMPSSIDYSQDTITCEHCQCESLLIEAFQPTNSGYLCPRCFEEVQVQLLEKKFKVYLWVVITSLTLALILYWLDSSWHYLFANVVIAAMLWYVTLIIYALTHAGAALILGGRVFHLSIGSGPILFKQKIESCQFTLRKFAQGSSFTAGLSGHQYLKPSSLSERGVW